MAGEAAGASVSRGGRTWTCVYKPNPWNDVGVLAEGGIRRRRRIDLFELATQAALTSGGRMQEAVDRGLSTTESFLGG